MGFAVGDRVTKKHDLPWVAASPYVRDHASPVYGEVYIVRGFDFSEAMQKEFVLLVGFADCYAATAFERVVEPKIELPESITKYLDSKNHKPLPEYLPGIEAFV